MLPEWLRTVWKPRKTDRRAKRRSTARRRPLRVEALEDRVVPAALFAEFLDPNPAPGNQFGHSVVPLSTGNVVITSPFDDAGGANAGAVYLFNGATGALISTLLGSDSNKLVGSGGITALTNGNFVVTSPNAGAITFGNGITGVSGMLSDANSLFGGTSGVHIGNGGVIALSNGNYLVMSPDWSNGTKVRVGAVTWGNGATGTFGLVSESNSLVGTRTEDQIGSSGATILNNGNFVVNSPGWDGDGVNYGAVTWGSGSTGISGAVNALNSLVGSRQNDAVGSAGVTALTNGNYVSRTRFWDNGTIANVGAVTWGNGETGISGVVSASNSLVGSTAADQVGGTGVTALSNGNYVVVTQFWDNGSAVDAGAVTWANGTVGITGVINESNSLVGSNSGDRVGGSIATGVSGLTALSNGNYVVVSHHWDDGGIADVGAVTWANGTTGISGTISSSNSLMGSNVSDVVGNAGVIGLSNGNYVIVSKWWGNGSTPGVGAVTWASGTSSISGHVVASNSLIGSSPHDNVGGAGVKALNNGNYVVLSTSWDSAGTANVGAVTWGNGASGTIGVVSVANSLIGNTANDQVGIGGVTALANGNYVVRSEFWDNGGVADVGAVSWADGSTGNTGAVSATNSLVGSSTDDRVGVSGVTALANGNYLVRSEFWDNSGVVDASALSWGDGTTGIAGTVSAANSLVGTTVNDSLGSGGVMALTNGNFVLCSPNWDHEGTTNVGAVTIGNGATGVSGDVSAFNSLMGASANASLQPVVADDVNDTFFARFLNVGSGRVWVGSQVDGFTPSVNGRIWYDNNSNGIRESGDADIPGVVGELFGSTNATIGDADDVSLGEQITASNGSYSFLDPQAFANYYVAFTPPVDFDFTLQDQGTDDFFDSDADPLTGRTAMFTVGPNEGVVRDAGLFTTLAHATKVDGNVVVTGAVDPNNELTISYNPGAETYIFSNSEPIFAFIPGATGSGTTTVTIPASAFTGGITFNGGDGDDTLTLDFSGGNPIPAGGFDYNGGAGSDTLVLSGGSGFTSTAYNAGGATSGSGNLVLSDGVNGNRTISFTGLEPITSNIASDIVTIIIDPSNSITGLITTEFTSAGAGMSTATFTPGTIENFTFANPTDLLQVSGDANDIDEIIITSLGAGFSAGVSIDGLGGNDGIFVDSPLTLAADRDFILKAGLIDLANTEADVAVSGSGQISLTATRNIRMFGGSSLTAVDGSITLSANQGVTPVSGDFVGIDINAATVQVTGEGDLTFNGRGGDTLDIQFGVSIQSNSLIQGGTTGLVNITGVGGPSEDGANHGVLVGTGSLITSSGASVMVTGTGGGTGDSSVDFGIFVHDSGQISAGGDGDVTVTGFGGTSAGFGGSNIGVYVRGINSRISSGGGNVSVNGTGGGDGTGGGSNTGVVVELAGEITAGGTGTVTVQGFGGDSADVVGFNLGVDVVDANSKITSAGGNVSVTGTGGNGGDVLGGNVGVFVSLGAEISAAGSGEVTVTGFGGNLAEITDGNWGVIVGDTDTQITSAGGNVTVNGTGGGSGTSNSNYGVFVSLDGEISAGSTGTVTVTGTAGNLTGPGFDNEGVLVSGTNARITSAGGDVFVTGIGTATSEAIWLEDTGVISSGGTANLTITGDSLMVFDSTASIQSGGVLTIRTRTAGTKIDLGGLDVLSGSPLTLGLDTLELDQVSAGTLVLGRSDSGDIAVSANIVRTTATNVELVSGDDIVISGGQVNTGGGTLLLHPGTAPNAVKPTKSATDATASTVSFGSDLSIAINGTTVDTEYDQLNVIGTVDLTGVSLVLTGEYVPLSGEVFTIVSATSRSGEFTGLSQGGTVTLNGVPLTVDYTATTVTLSKPPNVPPFLDAFADVIDSTNEDTEVELTFAELAAQGNESDPDGIVVAFVVTEVVSGTLKIGSSAGTATAFQADVNDTIDASKHAYWTPPASVIGAALNAFNVVAQDNDGTVSTPAVTAQVQVTAPATHFSVGAPATATAGVGFNVTVTALDQFNNTAINYTGTVLFTSTDLQAGLPVGVTLTAGVGTFSVTLKTAGLNTITATDTTTSSITGTSDAINVIHGPTTNFLVVAPTSAVAGVTFEFTVTARDAFGNTATGFTGNVAFASTGSVTLPPNSTLNSGTRTFNATLRTAGNRTITATATASAAINGTSNTIAVSPAAVSNFVVVLPGITTAGVAMSGSIVARDQFNNTATNYTGTVHFTSTDPQAVLPVDGTLAGGSGPFEATLKTSGFHTVTASDSTTPSATGTSGTIFVFHSATTHFTVAAPTTATAGSPFNFTVTARDQFGNTTPDYLGTVHITSSDGNAALPADATLLQGAHTFSATLKTAGDRTLTATDTTTPSFIGTSNTIAVSAANATHFVVSAPASATAGVDFSVTVTARDLFNNTATGYTGTVHFTATSAGTLPTDSTLTNGIGNFSASLTAAGPRTITARDVTTASIVGTSSTTTVVGAAATHFTVSIPGQFTAGAAFIAIVTARDEFSNSAVGYSGNIHFTSTDPAAALPPDSALNNGQFFFAVVLSTAGPRTITVTDTVTPAIAGTSNTITVLAAAAHHFALSAPASTSAGSPFGATVTAQDLFNNTATSYTGTVHFTSSDAGAGLPANYHFVPGDAGVRTFSGLTLTATGNQSVTVTDTISSPISGSAVIDVTGGVTARFAVSAPPNSTAGNPVVFTVIALDSLDNVVPSDFTVNLSASDAQAALPLSGTLDDGIGFFVAILRTAGTQAITASDAVTASINGTSSSVSVAVSTLHHFGFTSLPSGAITGNSFDFTVAAQDAFNNTVPTYSGTVQFTSNDSAGPTLPGNAALIGGVGTFSATFKTPGNRTLTATDTTTPSITGTSPVIATRGLVVSGATPTVNGFSVDFNKPFSIGTPGARILNLYDAVGAFGVSDVTLARNAIQTITFNSFANNNTFTLAFLGSTTAPITYVNTSAAALQTNIQNALNALSSVGVGNSLVTALNSTSVSVMFQGALGFKAVAGLSASPAAVTIANTMIGSNNLRGSLVIDADNQGMTFALSGTGTAGVLAADVYQITIRSDTNAFKDQLGSLLDGNDDGVPGDDFVTTFTVAATPTVILSLPDFARGPDSVYNIRVPNNAGEEVQTINFAGTANGSTFTLSFSGVTTGPITYSTVATTLQGNIQTALDVLASIDNSRRAGTLITSTNATSAAVRFMNRMGSFNQPQLATTTPTVSISTTTQGFSTGIPVTLSGATGVTGLSFDVPFDPTLLQITGTHNLATTAGPVGSTLTLTGVTPVSPNESIATFAFSIGTAPALGATATLGHIVAHVPDAASSLYKAKQLVRLTNIVATGAAAAPVGNHAVHVAAFFGDATGDGTFSGGDASAVSRVASNADTVPGTTQVGGLGAYPLLDPFVLTDFNNTGPTDSSDVSLINSYLVRQQSQIPTPPVGFSKTDSGPDPTLSLPTDLQAAASETVVVPVFIDITRPGDSPGMMEAILALRYDTSVFTVKDITLGSVVAGLTEADHRSASAWQLRSAVNADTGEIGINIYSMNPILTRGGGSLVYITMQVRQGAIPGPSSINLVPRVNPTGNLLYRTSVSDVLDQYILYPTITDGYDVGVDGQVMLRGQGSGFRGQEEGVRGQGTRVSEIQHAIAIQQVGMEVFPADTSDTEAFWDNAAAAMIIPEVFGASDGTAWYQALSELGSTATLDSTGLSQASFDAKYAARDFALLWQAEDMKGTIWMADDQVGHLTKLLKRKPKLASENDAATGEQDSNVEFELRIK